MKGQCRRLADVDFSSLPLLSAAACECCHAEGREIYGDENPYRKSGCRIGESRQTHHSYLFHWWKLQWMGFYFLVFHHNTGHRCTNDTLKILQTCLKTNCAPVLYLLKKPGSSSCPIEIILIFSNYQSMLSNSML